MNADVEQAFRPAGLGDFPVARQTGLESQTFTLPPPAGYLAPGENVIAIQAHNVSLANSSDFFIDVRLVGLRTSTGRRPTPGSLNSVYADNIPPLIRQVDHHPKAGGESTGENDRQNHGVPALAGFRASAG
ncbi:MAG: hypothetical protein FJ398_20210 [Verrucomicrobia bacterium]|nr:hypothetical protein [Verrucomicrobiota bacterium]